MDDQQPGKAQQTAPEKKTLMDFIEGRFNIQMLRALKQRTKVGKLPLRKTFATMARSCNPAFQFLMNRRAVKGAGNCFRRVALGYKYLAKSCTNSRFARPRPSV